MMENEKIRLMELTMLEAAEFERMAGVLGKKLQAVSKLDTASLQNIVVEELSVLKKIQLIEKDRASVLKSLSLQGTDISLSVNKRNSRALEKKLGQEDSEKFINLHSDLKKSFMKVQSLNGICRALLRHSLSFIRHNIHILTDGGNRRLVDRRA